MRPIEAWRMHTRPGKRVGLQRLARAVRKGFAPPRGLRRGLMVLLVSHLVHQVALRQLFGCLGTLLGQEGSFCLPLGLFRGLREFMLELTNLAGGRSEAVA